MTRSAVNRKEEEERALLSLLEVSPSTRNTSDDKSSANSM